MARANQTILSRQGRKKTGKCVFLLRAILVKCKFIVLFYFDKLLKRNENSIKKQTTNITIRFYRVLNLFSSSLLGDLLEKKSISDKKREFENTIALL